MVSKQERLAARQRRASAKADAVIEQAVAKVVAARPARKAATEAPPTPAPSQGKAQAVATPEAVRAMRDGGATWMEVGKHFGLPGAKYGAGRARQLYAAVNGGVVPRAYKPRAGAVVKPQGPASRSIPDYVRKQALVDNGHVIPRDMPDEEVEAYLVGRRIEWAIDMAKLTKSDPETWGGEFRWVKQEAKVHPNPEWVYVYEDDNTGERVVRFREYGGYDTDRGRHMAGPTRVVRVDAIFTVR